MRRHAKRFVNPPVDPRSKRVVASRKAPGRGGGIFLELECGHVQRRRLICAPFAVVCTDCPPAGGIGRRT